MCDLSTVFPIIDTERAHGKTDTYCEMLEEPCPHDVGGDLREDASFFLSLFVLVWIVIVARAG